MISNLSSEKDYRQQVCLLNIVSSLGVYAGVIIGEGFEINVFEDATFSPSGPPQPLSSFNRRSVRHTEILVTKRQCDDVLEHLLVNNPVEKVSWILALTLKQK